MKIFKKRTIISITHYTKLYGANKSLLNLIEGTQDEINWIVFCRAMKSESGDIREELKRLNIKHFSVPFRVDVFVRRKTLLQTNLFFLIEFIFQFTLAAFIALYARLVSAQYIHSNSTATCLGAYISFISRISHIWHFREFLSKDYNYEYKFGIKYFVYWANKAYKIIAISKAIHDECVINRNITTNSEILYNGVIPKKSIVTLVNKELYYPIKLLIIGVLDPGKNQLEAIKAVKILKHRGHDVELSVSGEASGEYFNQLVHFAHEYRLEDSVVFTGYLRDAFKAYSRAHITLVCSRNEGMGRVTVESMALGIPVIGFDAAGTSELIEHNHSGVLYRNDEVGLANEIERLWLNRELYESLRVNAHKLASEKFVTEKYAQNFFKLVGINT